jgi:hypothetical protein
MKLSAVALARALAFVETFDLNPRGKVFFPALVQAMIGKFAFVKFPEKPEDFDEAKGVEFSGGYWDGITVESLKIFNYGLLVDTRASTEDSERILEEGLLWASSEFGLEYNPQMIKRRAYVSDLTFYTEVPILGQDDSPVLRLAERAQSAVSKITGDKTEWKPSILTLNSDALPRKPLHAPFTIQRRAETAFSENKYYSEAPLPTDLHLSLLEQFEADVLASSA